MTNLVAATGPSTHRATSPGKPGRGALGVLSLHLDGAPCAVACPFCYLGARQDGGLTQLRRRGAPSPADGAGLVENLRLAVERLEYAELAIAVSEPVDAARQAAVLGLAEAARRRGRPVAITTTADVVERAPQLLDGADRLNLSVDPWKLGGDGTDEARAILDRVEAVAAIAKRRRSTIELIAIATLSTPGFAERLVGGLLADLVATAGVDGVALNALKPPPPFCDRAFWLSALARLRPLLDRELDRRLHLDCYVAARLLGIGGCPARPDLSPTSDGRLAFRSCVYAARADAELPRDALAEALDDVAAGFRAPAVCPFDTRL